MVQNKQQPSSYYKGLDSVAKSILVGHTDPLKKVLKRFELHKSGMIDKNRPVGSFLLTGPTGCGKTTLVQAIAYALHGDSSKFIRVDCGEYQSSHEVAKLIGAPPGYLGHRETEAVLSQESIKRHLSKNSNILVLLFDEVEKADIALHNILLGVMDAGRITLGDNSFVEMNDAFLFMTSNCGVKSASDNSFGILRTVHTGEQQRAIISGAVKKTFSPEFRNRLDDILIMAALTEQEAKIVATREINKFVARCPATIKVTPELINYLVDRGYSREFGARNIKRIIERDMMLEVARIILNASHITKNTIIYIDVKEGEISYIIDKGKPKVATKVSGN